MKRSFIITLGTIVVAGFVFLIMPISSLASGNITLEQAKMIALENAGLKANEVTIVKECMEIDDGKTQFEIEFYKGNNEYDYVIDAASGAVVSFDKEIETKYMTTVPKANDALNKTVTKEQAIQIALDRAGGEKTEVSLLSVKKDVDDGMEIYEVKFHMGADDYKYDIAISDGQIVDHEIDD